MVDFATGWLADLYGADVKKAIGKTSATAEASFSFMRGAFSAAAPGGPGGRRMLMAPLRDRLFFAGEAVHERCGARSTAPGNPATAPPDGAAAVGQRAEHANASKMSKPKALIAWSSGKDSAWALHEVRRAEDYDVVGALTTVTETFGRVSMHGVREEILRAQHAAIGLPSVIVPISYPCPNEIYEARMAAALEQAKRDGVTHVIFGDLFLEDVRAYRESKLAGTGITPLFPLWRRPTDALAREMIAAGVETYLVCIDLNTAEVVRRSALRCRTAGRPACGHRPMRREGRISLVRGRGPDVRSEDRGGGRRNRRARRFCLCGPYAREREGAAGRLTWPLRHNLSRAARPR